jgi:membrane-associated phospholipid phosphatase
MSGGPVYPVPRACVYVAEFGKQLLALDAVVARALNASIRRSRRGQQLASAAATGLAGAEIALMLGLAARGQLRLTLRMLIAVGAVYGACELIGVAWRRERPFAGIDEVDQLVGHRPGRSFPSRHVASGVAMATIGYRAHPRLGRTMALLAWLLGLSRVAAGLHYPSDVLAGVALGRVVGLRCRYS